jgi:hypothetical protein
MWASGELASDKATVLQPPRHYAEPENRSSTFGTGSGAAALVQVWSIRPEGLPGFFFAK